MDDRDPKVWKLARILIGKHGTAATQVAHARAQDSLDHQDYDCAALWSVTAKITSRMSTGGARRRPANPEPPLGELMNDPVTQTVMAGDGINRAELEQVIGEAKQKLQD
jgi:hypothetical protein